MIDASIVEKNERVFQFYEILPPELRTMVIDDMKAGDKGTFAQCSKQANVETKVSNNYVYSLEFHGYSRDDLQIEVLHGEYENYDDMNNGFYWNFKKVDGKKTMDCIDLNEKQVWIKDLDESVDLVDFAANHFKDYLKKYQRTIKKLLINDLFEVLQGRQTPFDLELNALTKLKELKVYDIAGIEQILSKLRRPLKLLEVVGSRNSRILPEYLGIYRVSNILLASECRLNYEQLKDLTAERCEIHIGDLTEEQIFKFIESWRNGTMDNTNSRFYRWELKNSEFSLVKFFELLGHEFDGSSTKTVTIKNKKIAEKEAEVYFNNYGAVLDKKFLTFKEIGGEESD